MQYSSPNASIYHDNHLSQVLPSNDIIPGEMSRIIPIPDSAVSILEDLPSSPIDSIIFTAANLSYPPTTNKNVDLSWATAGMLEAAHAAIEMEDSRVEPCMVDNDLTLYPFGTTTNNSGGIHSTSFSTPTYSWEHNCEVDPTDLLDAPFIILHSTPRNCSTPPPLPRRIPIPLPLISPDMPIEIHPLLRFRDPAFGANASLHWNIALPPSAASLAQALRINGHMGWLQEAVLQPRFVGSIVIRIPTIERAVVVFPETIGGFIRIIDVLKAISSALREAVILPLIPGTGGTFGARDPESANHAVLEAIASDAIQKHFKRWLYWAGLSESASERDVWTLKLYGPRQSGRRIRVLYE